MIKKFEKYLKENNSEIFSFTFAKLASEYPKTKMEPNIDGEPRGSYINFENILKELMVGKSVSFPCCLDPIQRDGRKECIVEDLKVMSDSQIHIFDDKGIKCAGRYSGNPGEDLNVYILNGDKKITKLKNTEIDPFDEEDWGYSFESSEIDPYGEENWNDKDLFEIGDTLIAKTNAIDKQDGSVLLTKGNRYIITNVINKPDYVLYCVNCDNGTNRRLQKYKMKIYFTKVLNEKHSEIDPYDEENWNEEEKSSYPYIDDYYDNMEMRGSECRLCGQYIPNIYMTNGICEYCRDCRCIHCGQFNRPEDIIRGWCENCRDERDGIPS